MVTKRSEMLACAVYVITSGMRIRECGRNCETAILFARARKGLDGGPTAQRMAELRQGRIRGKVER